MDSQYLAIVSLGTSLSFVSCNQLGAAPSILLTENVVDICWSPKNEKIILCSCGDKGNVLKLMNVHRKTCLKVVNVGAAHVR